MMPHTPSKSTTKQGSSHSEPTASTSNSKLDNNINPRSKRQRTAESPKTSTTQSICVCSELKTELLQMLSTWKSDQEQQLTKWRTEQDTVLSSLVSEVSELKRQCLDIERGMSFINSNYEDMKKNNDDLSRRVEVIDIRVTSAENMNEQVSSLVQRVEQMEQQARLNNIEICNLPERRDEDLLTLVERVGASIKCPISRRDVLNVHRVPHPRSQESGRPKNVIVKLASRELRNNVLSAFRLTKNISSNDIGISGTSHKIYVNEHLTLYNKNLFRECREMARKHNIKYVWIKNATILVKATDTSKTIAVRCLSDIKKFGERSPAD